MVAPRSRVRPASSSDWVCWSAISSVPAVGRSSRPMMLSSVLLPEPDGPLSATNSASRSASVMPCSTSVSTGVPTL
jgi:hypothetical protein